MASKCWLYNAWTCCGDLHDDGSMWNATICDHYGLYRNYNAHFDSYGDFVRYVDSHMKV